MARRAAFHNLGCKVNSYELDIMRQVLAQEGYEEVPFSDEADVYVVNTCSVTNIADRKSRQMLHRAKKRNPAAVVVAVGCYVETDPAGVEKDPAVDLAIGSRGKERIGEQIAAYLRERDGASPEAAGSVPEECGTICLRSPGHTRAFVKIQDGCNQFCTYCIIPYARGRIRSREESEICEEIRHLTEESGVREVVLGGIHLSSFGQSGNVPFDPETGGRSLLSLLRKLQEIPGLQRIRLGSLEPRVMTEDFVRGISGLTKVCPHFHLSLQSGCDATLKRMNRHYTAEEYHACLERLRKAYDRPAITTDVIVGFPGETEEEFAETVRFLKEIALYEIHVFKFSVRKGTVAEKLPDQIPEPVKNERSAVLLALTEEQARQYRASFDGEEVQIILEEKVPKGGRLCWRGHTERYVECLLPVDEAGDAGQGDPVTVIYEAPTGGAHMRKDGKEPR